ncbi:MAG: Fic family protein [bacterium]
MFRPYFDLSEALEKRLQSIDEANECLRGLTFPPRRMKELKREALITSIYLIIQPEDHRVGYGRVARVLESMRKTSSDSTDRQIMNIRSALKKVRSFSSTSSRFTEHDLKEVYSLLNGQPEEKRLTRWETWPYRNSPRPVLEETQKKIYTTAPHEDIPSLMVDLLDWLEFEACDLHPIIKAIVAYFQILIVRPFLEDNCRTAWFLFLSTLSKNGVDFGEYVSLEKSIFMDRRKFQNNVLNLVAATYNPKNFSESQFQSYIKYLLPSIEDTVTERRVWLDREHLREVGEMLRKANLNERQRKALSYVAQKGKITNREYKELNGVRGRKRAWEELTYLAKEEILQRVGQGRNVAYELSPIMAPETVLKHL